MDNDTYDDRIPRMNDQTNIKFLKQEEFNANIVKRLEELEDFKSQALVRLDQEIENRTNAFTKIAQLENEVEALQIWKYNIETKLERIDNTLVVHRNQNDTQRKNHASLIKVWDEKVIPLIEGTHGKQE